MIHFLLVFDHDKNQLLEATPFTDANEAASRYTLLEERHRGSKALEIVLVGSDSIETIHQTHGNYFEGTPSKAYRRYLVDVF
jgi:hypothetical protein